jgi:hypothetical protein
MYQTCTCCMLTRSPCHRPCMRCCSCCCSLALSTAACCRSNGPSRTQSSLDCVYLSLFSFSVLLLRRMSSRAKFKHFLFPFLFLLFASRSLSVCGELFGRSHGRIVFRKKKKKSWIHLSFSGQTVESQSGWCIARKPFHYRSEYIFFEPICRR